MKLIISLLKLTAIVFILTFSAFAEQSNEPQPQQNPITFGASIGYAAGYNNSDSYYPLVIKSPISSFKVNLDDEFMHGFFIGASARFTFYDGDRVSHNLHARISYESLYKTILKKEPVNYISEGKIVEGTIDQEFSLRFEFVNLELLYTFNIGNKHIGFIIGPTYSFLINNRYEFIEKPDWSLEEPTRLFSESGEIKDLVDSNFGISVGLEFVVNFSGFDLVPFAKYYGEMREIQFGEDRWTMTSYRTGLEFRF